MIVQAFVAIPHNLAHSLAKSVKKSKNICNFQKKVVPLQRFVAKSLYMAGEMLAKSLYSQQIMPAKSLLTYA